MAKKAKKKVMVRAPVTKATRYKSAKPARKPAGRKPAPKAARRSSAEVAKLRKVIVAALKAGKPAADVAKQLGISKVYVYVLNRAR